MGKSFNSLEEMMSFIQTQVNESLTDNVARQVKDEINMSVSENIYEKYSPEFYERRGLGYGSGGLADQSQMSSELISNGVLEVQNNAQPSVTSEYNGLNNDKTLMENIEYGYGSKDKEWNKPRQVIGKAKQEMESTKSHVQALVNGLIERGIMVDGKEFK